MKRIAFTILLLGLPNGSLSTLADHINGGMAMFVEEFGVPHLALEPLVHDKGDNTMFGKPTVTVKLVRNGQTRHISANAGDYYPGMLVDGWRVVAIY